MAKQRPSVRKREREIQKRQRELKKSRKAAAKRERRLNRDRQASSTPSEVIDVAVAQDKIVPRDRTDSDQPGITEERRLGQT
jgi:hypothetical protein